MIYKAVVKNKRTGQLEILEMEYKNKKAFIRDIRGNGYAVNPMKVKPAEAFDYIMQHTNCQPWDWKNN